MGYYTQFKLDIESGEESYRVEELADTPDGEKVTILGKKIDILHQIHSLIPDQIHYEESVKWYDHENDMRKISKDYPDHVLRLAGQGEEADDLWVKFFHNGLMQKVPATISYDPYDPEKLK